MPETSVRIPERAWYGDTETELTFPEGWQVQECRMAGHDTPELSDAEIREALENPIGAPALSELA